MAVFLLDLYVCFEFTICLKSTGWFRCCYEICDWSFLTCKSKTWWQYGGGCMSKLLCVCLVYDIWCILYVVGNFAIALFCICIMKSKFKMCYELWLKNTLNMSDSVALSRGNALPLPLRPKTSGHAALASAVSACSSDCAVLAWEV